VGAPHFQGTGDRETRRPGDKETGGHAALKTRIYMQSWRHASLKTRRTSSKSQETRTKRQEARRYGDLETRRIGDTQGKFQEPNSPALRDPQFSYIMN